jgi:transposase
MLGLPGFVVLGAGEAGGELELLAETTARRTGCSRCGVVAVPHGRREHLVRDLHAHGRAVLLVWSKRIWRCADPDCAKRTWTEISQGGAAGGADRAGPPLGVPAGGRDEQTVAAVARELGVGWGTVMRAVRDHGQPLIDDPARLEGVTGLGVDEHVRQHASARRFTQSATGITDLSPAAGRGCWRCCPAAPARSAQAGWPPAMTPGRRRSASPRWTRSAGMPLP